jgi:DnaJ-class molecular chaperone
MTAALWRRDGILLAALESGRNDIEGTPLDLLSKRIFSMCAFCKGRGFVRHMIMFKRRCINCKGIGKVNRVTFSRLGLA